MYLLEGAYEAYHWSDDDKEYMGKHTVAYEKEYCEKVLKRTWVGPEVEYPETSQEVEQKNKQKKVEWDKNPDQTCGGSVCCTDGKF